MADTNLRQNTATRNHLGSVRIVSMVTAPLARLLDVIIRPRSAKTEGIMLFVLLALTLIAAILTALVMLDVGDTRQDSDVISLLLFSDLVLLCALVLVVVRNILRFRYRSEGLNIGTHFRTRMVLIFALFSAVPAIILTAFSLLFLDLGLENWFSERIKTTVEESKAVARAYLNENANSIGIDAVLLARSVVSGLQNSGDINDINPILNRQARFRDISEAIIFRRDGAILGRYGLTFDMEFESIPEWAFVAARRGEVPLLRNAENDERRIRALILLEPTFETYMVVGRAIDPQVLEHVQKTEETVSQYQDLELTRLNLQISFTAGFVLISLLVLFVAVLLGMQFASNIWLVLENLLSATARIAKGKFNPVDFPKRPEGDEIGVLNNAFNDMILQLGRQRRDLLDASEQIDQRRRFSEAVLAGVSAGVIGLDRKGRVDLLNRKAEELLNVRLSRYKGKPLASAVPQFADLLTQAKNLYRHHGGQGLRFVDDRIHFETQVKAQVGERETASGLTPHSKEFFVRIGLEITKKGDLTGYVVTFDDLTDLLAAQRQAAWADIARRIAHEVKNPLTPIQLSAERLKRKYGKLVAESSEKDLAVFEECIATIIRQVRDIGALVNEFSDFARMPKAIMEPHDIAEICRDAVSLEKSRAPFEVEISFASEVSDLHASVDRRQLSQLLINLIKNSTESLQKQGKKDSKISITLTADRQDFHICVADNGPGFSNLQRDWTQPYVTDKDGGSGLGLAIVKKIVDDHGGHLYLRNNKGAEVHITIPLTREPSPESSPEPSPKSEPRQKA